MSWAIKNRRTGKYVYGTDYRYNPPHQRTSYRKALIYEDEEECEMAMQHRECGKNYKAVNVYLCEIAGRGFCGL